MQTAAVAPLGLTTDRQRNTKYHGGPDRALCLYSLERILALQKEGHPIYPGAIGENLTITGLDWSLIRPGTRLQLGNQVAIEITSYAALCKQIRAAFVDHYFTRVSDKKFPGWARGYARVLQPGDIRVGDGVTVIKTPDTAP